MPRFLADIWRAWLFLRKTLRDLTDSLEAFFHNVRVLDIERKEKKGRK